MFALTISQRSLTQRVLFTQTRSVSLLSRLHPSLKSTKTFKRVGRGPSSGYGKTSSRGQKGQKARGTVKPWFEGGQTPITKLFPKVGFKRPEAQELCVVNLERIVEFYKSGRLQLDEGEVLTMRKMKQSGLVSGSIKDGVKILAEGKEAVDFPIKIEATRASTEAIRAIERAGGEFTAKYFSKLSLQAHVDPLKFFIQRGHVPLPARPTRGRDIRYYTRVDKRGYLAKNKEDPLIKAIEKAQSESTTHTKKVVKTGISTLDLPKVNKASDGFQKSGIFKLADLQL